MRLSTSLIGLTLSLGFAAAQAPAHSGTPLVLPLWPHGVPDAVAGIGPEKDLQAAKAAIPGKGHNAELTNVTIPTMTVYFPPAGVKNTGAAALVYPGGGYQFLNMKNAGTDPCEWLTSIGITCVLVKYRVPNKKPFPDDYVAFEDGQQAMRLTRQHAVEWKIDPNRIGAMGFSAGGHLAMAVDTHPDDKHVLGTSAAQDVPMAGGKPVDAKLNFAILCWPGLAVIKPEERELVAALKPVPGVTPVTFVIQAEDDPLAGPNGIVYYRALMDAKISAELHYYPTGKHAFGMHPEHTSQERWAEVAANWLRFNKIIP